MRAIYLYLVRHGESVDNVANLYAGSHDGPLTSHGVLQARRLGAHLATRTASARVRHIFASNLQRAYRTAEAVRDSLKALPPPAPKSADVLLPVSGRMMDVVQLPDLREKHFGSAEGQKIGTRAADKKPVGAEDQEAMRVRAQRFVDDYLAPIFACLDESEDDAESVIVVAHGIILGVLARCLRSPGTFGTVASTPDDQTPWGWRNTGYAEIHISSSSVLPPKPPVSNESPSAPKWPNLSCKTVAVNCIDHLQGLKKTRGGIGSAKFDEKQKTLNAFFTPTAKKRKHYGDGDET